MWSLNVSRSFIETLIYSNQLCLHGKHTRTLCLFSRSLTATEVGVALALPPNPLHLLCRTWVPEIKERHSFWNRTAAAWSNFLLSSFVFCFQHFCSRSGRLNQHLFEWWSPLWLPEWQLGEVGAVSLRLLSWCSLKFGQLLVFLSVCFCFCFCLFVAH